MEKIIDQPHISKLMFERIKYPDGQIGAKMVTNLISHHVIEVAERINSYEDLFYVASIADVLKHRGIKGTELFIPCMFGQRSDRRFTPMQSFDLNLITDTINACSFQKVTVFDPHSDVTLALLNNVEKKSSFECVSQALWGLTHAKNIPISDIVLVSPDAGAYKKVFEYGEKLNLPVVAANKFRALDGTITLHFIGDVASKVCLIVDDLCDGGYTFIQLGKALKEQGASKVFLYVSHGYFSKGFKELQEVLDGIYCTNSVKDIGEVQFDGWNHSTLSGFLTQYKIV